MAIRPYAMPTAVVRVHPMVDGENTQTRNDRAVDLVGHVHRVFLGPLCCHARWRQKYATNCQQKVTDHGPGIQIQNNPLQ
jgi:hypothetical protein